MKNNINWEKIGDKCFKIYNIAYKLNPITTGYWPLHMWALTAPINEMLNFSKTNENCSEYDKLMLEKAIKQCDNVINTNKNTNWGINSEKIIKELPWFYKKIKELQALCQKELTKIEGKTKHSKK